MSAVVVATPKLADRFRAVRAATERLCEPLEVEDYGLQSMPECSPPKWHLAHTTWFFETFVLAEHEPGFQPYHPQFRHLFNSYYEAVGKPWPRPARGLLSRPTVAEVYAYRRSVDGWVLARRTTAHAHESRPSSNWVSTTNNSTRNSSSPT